jgi:hypothetical protein
MSGDLREMLRAAAEAPPYGVDLAHVHQRARTLGRRRRLGAVVVAIATVAAVLVGVRLLPDGGGLSRPTPLPPAGPVRPGDYNVREFVPSLELTIPDEGWRVTAKSWSGVTLTHRDGTLVVDRWSDLAGRVAVPDHGGAAGSNLPSWIHRSESFSATTPTPVTAAGFPAIQLDLMLAKPSVPKPPQCVTKVGCALLASDGNGWLWLGADETARLIVLPTDIGGSAVTIFVKSKSNNLPRFLEEVAPIIDGLRFAH